MKPQEFIQQWSPGGPAYGPKEEQGAQTHVLYPCGLLPGVHFSTG